MIKSPCGKDTTYCLLMIKIPPKILVIISANLNKLVQFLFLFSDNSVHQHWFTLGGNGSLLGVTRAAISVLMTGIILVSVSSCAAAASCQPCALWLSFIYGSILIHHLPRVLFMFILAVALLPPESPCFSEVPFAWFQTYFPGSKPRVRFAFYFLMKYCVSVDVGTFFLPPAASASSWISCTCGPVPHKRTDAASDGFAGFSGYS